MEIDRTRTGARPRPGAGLRNHLPPLPEASVTSPRPESRKRFRARLADSVREPLDQGGRTWTSIQGPYPDRVIVCVRSRPALNGPW
ncbi:conserved hypothetical protein [Streptomyces pristinaespiralis ATCC 25486]|uniref:Uncharacterized protein n=1 Tax=Streptomyces pristinaespiralis (strain ATCC 25486 / DSM 40338 / CBS 914.69 / JCM 4507 / KCC S-0507 / NBRC 13074 / NRRL 2958 / 5647) TaxID=457429 RepID=B5HBQ0_STRE2|nr:conserved hypothetical protein [Streptomyces pristinaespiralis ATCC 25486]